MALKPDRVHLDSAIDSFMNAVAERGGILHNASTSASGVAMDQSQLTVEYKANPSGVEPVGVLMNDVVNYDLTRQHINWHKDEVQLGGKVTIWSKCTVVTDKIMPSQTPTPGQVAYVGHSGLFSASDVATDHVDPATSQKRKVGRFVTGKDEEGFAKIQVNLP